MIFNVSYITLSVYLDFLSMQPLVYRLRCSPINTVKECKYFLIWCVMCLYSLDNNMAQMWYIGPWHIVKNRMPVGHIRYSEKL